MREAQAEPSPGTTMASSALVVAVSAFVAGVVLNERVVVTSPGSSRITVNAVHVTLLGLLPSLSEDVVVAQARCSATRT